MQRDSSGAYWGACACERNHHGSARAASGGTPARARVQAPFSHPPSLAPVAQAERGPGKAHLHDNIEYLYTSLKSLYRCRAHQLAVVVFALVPVGRNACSGASAHTGLRACLRALCPPPRVSLGPSMLPAPSFSVLALQCEWRLARVCVMCASGADLVPLPGRERVSCAQPVVPPAGRSLQLPRLFFTSAIGH